MERKSVVSVKLECYGLSSIYYVTYDTGEVKKFYGYWTLPVIVQRFIRDADIIDDGYYNGIAFTVFEGVKA